LGGPQSQCGRFGEEEVILIIIIIPADRNVVQKEAEKKLKYKFVCIEIQRM